MTMPPNAAATMTIAITMTRVFLPPRFGSEAGGGAGVLLRRPCLPSSPRRGGKQDGEADINSRRSGLPSSAVRFSAFLRWRTVSPGPNVRKRATPVAPEPIGPSEAEQRTAALDFVCKDDEHDRQSDDQGRGRVEFRRLNLFRELGPEEDRERLDPGSREEQCDN